MNPTEERLDCRIKREVSTEPVLNSPVDWGYIALRLREKFIDSLAISAALPPRAHPQIPGEMVCDNVLHLFMQPTEACRAGHRTTANAPI
jgi:hypothetical protein